MNNSQFRKLVLNTFPHQSNTCPNDNLVSKSSNDASKSSMGSPARMSIQMAPRSVCSAGYSKDFARQVALRETALSRPVKKLQTSVVPKGTKLPEGYVDRAKSRLQSPQSQEKDDKCERVKALEQMMKLGQIDETTFIELRDQILGEEMGIERAALVKGLDWALLKKIKSGEMTIEDIVRGSTQESPENSHGENETREKNIDDELDEIEQRKVTAIVHEKIIKKGEMASPAFTGKKRTRDQIISDLKASRKAAFDSAPPRLGSKFKKVGEPRQQDKIIKDAKGREILITVDQNGSEKRKFLKQINHKSSNDNNHGLLIPDKDAKPLGMVVPEHPKVTDIEDNIDIFDDVGDDYDPLAELGNDDDSDEDESPENEIKKSGDFTSQVEPKVDLSTFNKDSMASQNYQSQPGRRDYFQTSAENSAAAENTSSSSTTLIKDPTIIAALKKASQISLKITNSEEISEDQEEDIAALRAKQERHKRMLQPDDRDAQDLDMSFGSSRIEDDIDADETNLKLLRWGALNDEEDKNEKNYDAKGKRKRGPKKRKADSNNAADVLRMMRQLK